MGNDSENYELENRELRQIASILGMSKLPKDMPVAWLMGGYFPSGLETEMPTKYLGIPEVFLKAFEEDS